MRQHALDDYRHSLILWAITAPYVKGGGRRPPSPPPILRESNDDDA
jgi:hypothetical protein